MKYLFAILFFVEAVMVSGQADSTRFKARVVKMSYEDIDLSSSLELYQIDTVLKEFHRYDFDGVKHINSVATPAGASESMRIPDLKYGFSFGESVFSAPYNEWIKKRVYFTNIPFARISYITGPKKYQDFNVLFTENINSSLNFTIKLRSFGSDGFYLNQNSSGKFFSIQSSYKADKNKYGYFVRFFSNSGQVNENGGIKGDSIYLSSLKDDKLSVQVWFDEYSKNFFDKRQVDVSQFYRFGTVDSTHNKYDGFFFLLDNKGFIDDFWYENSWIDSAYFQNFRIQLPDSGAVRDRAHLFGLENTAALKYSALEGNIIVKLGYGLNYYKPETIASDTSFFSHTLQVGIDNLRFGKSKFTGYLVKGMAGFNQSGYEFYGAYSRKVFNNYLKITGWYSSVKSLPDYKTMNYAGTVVSWNNSFDYIGMNTIGGVFRIDSFRLELLTKLSHISNYVYYGTNTFPVQYLSNIGSFEFRLRKQFVLKSYHFDIDVLYQIVNKEAPINISSWIWSISFYYQRYLFKDALELRYGVDYWQNSAYTANSYAPFTRSFVYQDTYRVGDFPYFSFYVSARIKSAQGFVRFQNLGQLLFEKSYMMIPYYPMQDFGMSFGLRWDFFN